ncbi:MAG: hypothetical protein IK099_12395 [Clostridia bacterium]|nr:hypothetical protein [Clostridia bacterium]
MFGYEILRGRQGAAGHFRESEGKTAIHAQGLKPGETCVIYALKENRAEKRGEAMTDGNGRAVWTGICGQPFFVAAHGKVLLWQGGEEDYLRAGECLKKGLEAEQKKKPPASATETAQSILEKDLLEIQTVPLPDETDAAEKAPKESAETAKRQEEQSMNENAHKTETHYTLRSPSGGEPVDTLPDATA